MQSAKTIAAGNLQFTVP